MKARPRTKASKKRLKSIKDERRLKAKHGKSVAYLRQYHRAAVT